MSRGQIRAASYNSPHRHHANTPQLHAQGEAEFEASSERARVSGERPMGTASYTQQTNHAKPRPPQGGERPTQGGERPIGTTAYGGKGSKGRAIGGDRPIGAASCRPRRTKVAYHPPTHPGGSVGTTDQGKGKGRSVVRPMGTVAYRGKGQGKGKGRGEGRLGQGGRGRSKGGEKLMGTTAYGGKGSKGRAANGDRPVGAASCRRDHHTMASCQNPPPTLMGHCNASSVTAPTFLGHKLCPMNGTLPECISSYSNGGELPFQSSESIPLSDPLNPQQSADLLLQTQGLNHCQMTFSRSPLTATKVCNRLHRRHSVVSNAATVASVSV